MIILILLFVKLYCLISLLKENKKVIFICDGKIDFCLSKNLNENDILCVRNNYSLYRILYEKNGLKEIKSKVEIWNNGLDIIKILENEYNK